MTDGVPALKDWSADLKAVPAVLSVFGLAQ